MENITTEQFEAVQRLLTIALDGQQNYLDSERPAQDYGGEWPDMARERSKDFRLAAKWLAASGRPDLVEDMNDLADEFKQSAAYYEIEHKSSFVCSTPATFLFIGTMPTGLSYCDRRREKHGDFYVNVAFLPYDTLELKIYHPDSDLLPAIQAHAATIQAQRGHLYQVSGSGKFVKLGYAVEKR